MNTKRRPRTLVWHNMTTLVNKALGIGDPPQESRWTLGHQCRAWLEEDGTFDTDRVITAMKEGPRFQDFALPDGEPGWRVRYVDGMRIVYVEKMVMHVSRADNYWNMKKRTTE